MGGDFEYTAQGMQQQNGHIEQKFATLFNWVCDMHNSSKFNAYLWNGLWAKVVNTIKLLKNKLITET